MGRGDSRAGRLRACVGRAARAHRVRGMTTALDAYEQIRREVVARLGDDASSAPRSDDRIRDAVVVAVDDYQSRAHHGNHAPLHDPAAMVERVLSAVTDLGALSELLARHDVEEIFIEGTRV